MPINDNPALENEADVMGKRAAEGKEISMYNSPSLGMRNSVRQSKSENGIIQRAVSTWGGEWDTDKYELRKDEDNRGNSYPASSGVRGVDIKLKFSPGVNADSDSIGLTQSVQGIVNSNLNLTTGAQTRHITSTEAININTGAGETDEGTAIDRVHSRNNPIYGSRNQGAGKTLEDTPKDNNSSSTTTVVGSNATYQLGHRKKNGKTWNSKDAILFDSPTRGGASKDSRHIFETTALGIKGAQAGAYYGSVRWGWRTDNGGRFTKIPLQKVSDGIPSSTFMKAAEKWNIGNGGTNIALPVQWTGSIQNTTLAALRLGRSTTTDVLADLPTNAKVTVIDDSSAWLHVQVDINQSGLVVSQLGKNKTLTGNILRGYVSKELIQKDATYIR